MIKPLLNICRYIIVSTFTKLRKMTKPIIIIIFMILQLYIITHFMPDYIFYSELYVPISVISAIMLCYFNDTIYDYIRFNRRLSVGIRIGLIRFLFIGFYFSYQIAVAFILILFLKFLKPSSDWFAILAFFVILFARGSADCIFNKLEDYLKRKGWYFE